MRQSKKANGAKPLSKLDFLIKKNEYDSTALNLNAYELAFSGGYCSSQANTDSVDEALDELAYLDAEFITAKLPCDRIDYCSKLEDRDFYYVETNLKPFLRLDNEKGVDHEDAASDIDIRPATSKFELEEIKAIAKTAFTSQRFFLDRRINYEQAQARYAQWAENAFYAEGQDLLIVMRRNDIGGFFLNQSDCKKMRWILNAIKVDFQGEGIGKTAWKKMITMHKGSNYSEVESSISAHNTRVLSLYASLGFRFKEPEVRMHWFKPHSDFNRLI